MENNERMDREKIGDKKNTYKRKDPNEYIDKEKLLLRTIKRIIGFTWIRLKDFHIRINHLTGCSIEFFQTILFQLTNIVVILMNNDYILE
jgi:hypothetical protein